MMLLSWSSSSCRGRRRTMVVAVTRRPADAGTQMLQPERWARRPIVDLVMNAERRLDAVAAASDVDVQRMLARLGHVRRMRGWGPTGTESVAEARTVDRDAAHDVCRRRGGRRAGEAETLLHRGAAGRIDCGGRQALADAKVHAAANGEERKTKT